MTSVKSLKSLIALPENAFAPIRTRMNADEEDGWTDEESYEKLVEKVNRTKLSELKDIVLSICPSFSFTAKDMYPL